MANTWCGLPKCPDLESLPAPKDLKAPNPTPEKVSDPDSFLKLLSHYGGLMAPDAVSTEMMLAKGGVEMNPIINEMPGRLGRMGYFAASALGMAGLEKLLQTKNPKLASLLRKTLGAGQGLMLHNNMGVIKDLEKLNVQPKNRR